jgi:hypothetical protein
MAAKQPRVGVDHPTVVPANVRPDSPDDDSEG